MNLARVNGWTFAACWLAVILLFFYGFLTLAGGGILILPVALAGWLGVLLYARARGSPILPLVVLTPVILYGLLFIAGLFIQVFS